jgi:hypothetical protein
MIVNISFDASNAAFEDNVEGELQYICIQIEARVKDAIISRSLDNVNKLRDATYTYKLRDSNGNAVGNVVVASEVDVNNL